MQSPSKNAKHVENGRILIVMNAEDNKMSSITMVIIPVITDNLLRISDDLCQTTLKYSTTITPFCSN